MEHRKYHRASDQETVLSPQLPLRAGNPGLIILNLSFLLCKMGLHFCYRVFSSRSKGRWGNCFVRCRFLNKCKKYFAQVDCPVGALVWLHVYDSLSRTQGLSSNLLPGVPTHPAAQLPNVGIIRDPSQSLLSKPSASPVAVPPTIFLISLRIQPPSLHHGQPLHMASSFPIQILS